MRHQRPLAGDVCHLRRAFIQQQCYVVDNISLPVKTHGGAISGWPGDLAFFQRWKGGRGHFRRRCLDKSEVCQGDSEREVKLRALRLRLNEPRACAS